MIILHNSHDKESREWVAANAGPDDVILDWYNPDDLAAWIEAGGTMKVSAFPSVIVEVPAHELDALDAQDNPVKIQIPRHYKALRKPADRAAVDALAAKIPAQAEKNPAALVDAIKARKAAREV